MYRILASTLAIATLLACSSVSSGSADVACQYAGTAKDGGTAAGTCEVFRDSTVNAASGYQTECTGASGKVVSACPTAGLLGCCTIDLGSGVTDEMCFYSGSGSDTAAALQKACVAGSGTTPGMSNVPGTWSTGI
jgi:hypothetical protein